MKKALVSLIALGSLIAVSCTLAPRDTGRGFVLALDHLPAASTHVAMSPDTLVVALPTAAPELDTARIALVKQDGHWDYYAGAKWPDFLPLVVQDSLTESLSGSGLYKTVVSDQSGARGGQKLATVIRSFQTVYRTGAAAPVAKVALSVRLTAAGEADAVAAFDVQAQAPAAQDRLGDIQTAFAAAFRSAQQQAILKLKQQRAATPAPAK